MPEFDPARLGAALQSVPAEDWSQPSTYQATGVHHHYRRVTLVSAGHRWPHATLFGFVFDEFAPVCDAWLSWIGPGGFIRPHRDAGPWRERWQVPIAPAGEFHAAEAFVPEAGRAFPVEHWQRHAVINDTTHPRVHLVIDRAVDLRLPAEPFHLYPIPDEMADLVRRSVHATST